MFRIQSVWRATAVAGLAALAIVSSTNATAYAAPQVPGETFDTSSPWDREGHETKAWIFNHDTGEYELWLIVDGVPVKRLE